MTDYPKRARILVLLDFFRDYTDEKNPKTMGDIREYLEQHGVAAERKAIYSDISLLRDLGHDIIKTTEGAAAYFLGGRVMDVAEAEICASAVSAAKFITQKKSKELIDKLAGLFSHKQAAEFRERMALARALKTRNEEVYYNIDKITRALAARKKISFQYVEYLPDKTLRHRRDGRRYLCSLYSLMWFEDAFYVVCNVDHYDNLSHFRVDRMTMIDITDDIQRPVDAVSSYKNHIDFDEYHRSVFYMFGGKPQRARIRFRDKLATAVFDRFGLDVDVSDIKDGWFTISVNVRVSPGFISWLTIFGDDAEILAPGNLRDMMRALIASLSGVYGGGDD